MVYFNASEKKTNVVVPIHKKGDKQTLKNYHPVFLIPICSKIFERLFYNEMFGFLLHKDLISATQQFLNQETHNNVQYLQII